MKGIPEVAEGATLTIAFDAPPTNTSCCVKTEPENVPAPS